MKTKKLFTTLLFSTLFFAFFACSNDDNSDANYSELLKVTNEGVSTFALENVWPVLEATESLTADEIEFLYAVREDEKLSRDLNSAFSSLYPTSRQFANLAVAETNHITTIERLLTYYEIEFPPLTKAGIFNDETRQAEYNKLLSQGKTLVDAYKVIALLEEENIVAYQNVLPSITNQNIKLIMSNMLKSSTNHFKAVINQITILGEVYKPSLLDEKAYQEIIDSAFHHGEMHKHHGNHGHNNSEKGNKHKGHKGSVNESGNCSDSDHGNHHGSGSGKGHAGKGYRGGK